MVQRKAIKTHTNERSLVASVKAADRQVGNLRERVRSAEKAITKIDREIVLIRKAITKLAGDLPCFFGPRLT